MSQRTDVSRSDGAKLGAKDAGAFDEDDTLVVDRPEPFEDYDELNGDGEVTPEDRRRDPLRRSW